VIKWEGVKERIDEQVKDAMQSMNPCQEFLVMDLIAMQKPAMNDSGNRCRGLFVKIDWDV